MAVPLVLWGTYDVGKPRVRNLIAALEQLCPGVRSSHFNLWSGVEDKSGIPLKRIIVIAARLLCCYPWLLYRYCRLPAHQVVVLPYPCVVDALVLWPFAKCRGAKLCCDLFLSLYDTAVVDRRLIKKASLAARLLYRIEWLTLRLADFILTDTQARRTISAIFMPSIARKCMSSGLALTIASLSIHQKAQKSRRIKQ